MGINECVQYVRDNFEKKYAENIASGRYDVRDLNKLQNDSTFVKSYIISENRLDEAVDLVHSSLKFKKEMKVNDLSENSFTRELFEAGVAFYHRRDISGHRILWLKAKEHRRDAPAERLALEKLSFIFAIEKAFTESPLNAIVILLDVTSCGMANVDLDFVKYIIHVFKFYYPTFLAYFLIYNMPWIFNATWKLAKTLLDPEAVAKVKFVTKADIQLYVRDKDLPPYMGGTDDFKYTYKPGMFIGPLYPEDEFKKDRKVHFQEVQECSSSSPSPGTSRSSSDSDLYLFDVNTNAQFGLSHQANNQNHIYCHGNLNNSAIDRKHKMEGFSGPGGFYISPAEELTFQIRDTGDSFDLITLTNTLSHPVAFKVKTTSPEKFRVRPSSGLIKPDKTEEVYVYLVPDQTWDVSKDKFLIMAMDIRSEGTDLNQVFRDAPKEKIMQHKLKCTVVCQDNIPPKPKPVQCAEKPGHDQFTSKPDSAFSQPCSSYGVGVPMCVLPQDFLQVPGQGSVQLPYHCTSQMPAQDSSQMPYHGVLHMPGQVPVHVPGQGYQQMPGQCCQQMPVQGCQQMPGQSIYQIPGQGSLQMPGQNSFNIPGKGSTELAGPGAYQMPCQATSHMPGQGSFFLNGQDYLQLPGQGPVAASGQMPLQVPGHHFSLQQGCNSYGPGDVNPVNPLLEAKTPGSDDMDKQVEQLELQTRHMQRQLNVLLVIQFLTAFTLLLVMLSYSCFGEDLFTHFLALPFDFCHDTYGRKC